MKILATSIFIFSVVVSVGQKHPGQDSIIYEDSIPNFRLTLSTFNHAERIFNGTTTYLLTESSIKVTRTFFGDTTSKSIYSKPISKSKNIISAINSIGLDSLKNFYSNNCVMLTSGNEYFLDFTSNLINKSVILHHYYLKQVDDVIKIINDNLPKKYQF